MTQSENIFELYNSPNKYYFDAPFNDYNCFAINYIFAIDIALSALVIIRMVLITKFVNFRTTKQ